MDLPLHTSSTSSALSDIGASGYQSFDHAVVLDQVMRQAGQDPSQVRFRQILLRLRNGEVTEDDWKHLMMRIPAQISDISAFNDALRLFPTVEAVVEHNISKLHACGQPVAMMKAVHFGPNATKASSDDGGGLEPIVCLAMGARVMLSSNLWVDMGLVNGAMGTIQTICYKAGQAPPLYQWLLLYCLTTALVPPSLTVQYQLHHCVGLGHCLVALVPVSSCH